MKERLKAVYGTNVKDVGMLNNIIDGVAKTPSWKAHVLPFYKEQCTVEAHSIIVDLMNRVPKIQLNPEMDVRIEKYLNVVSQLENIDVSHNS